MRGQARLPSLRSGASGQALVTLLFFTIIATTVITAAVLVIVVNSTSSSRQQAGSIAYQIAQSGADNALLRVLRDPNYTGEVLSVGSGSATVTRTGAGTTTDPYIFLSIGQTGNFIKSIEVTAHYDSSDQLIVDSQKEIF